VWSFILKNGRGKKYSASVTSRGQVVTAPIEYNDTYYNSMSATATAYNFVTPKTNKRFVITGYIVASNKDVSSTTGAEIPIIEASSPSSTTPTKTHLTLELGKLDGRQLTGLNIITTAGVWINASTDDASVNLTLLGYYVTA
jgi:hypothetical protein